MENEHVLVTLGKKRFEESRLNPRRPVFLAKHSDEENLLLTDLDNVLYKSD